VDGPSDHVWGNAGDGRLSHSAELGDWQISGQKPAAQARFAKPAVATDRARAALLAAVLASPNKCGSIRRPYAPSVQGRLQARIGAWRHQGARCLRVAKAPGAAATCEGPSCPTTAGSHAELCTRPEAPT